MSIEKAYATVRSVEQGTAIVESDRILCRRCAAGRGCGAGVLANKRRKARVTCPPGSNLQPGDRVALTLPGEQILKSALLVYGLPLAGLLIGAAFAAYLAEQGASPVVGLLATVGGLVAGLGAGARAARRKGCRPVLGVEPVEPGAGAV